VAKVNKGPSLNPIKLRSMLGEVWYYEGRGGIQIYLSAGLIRSGCNAGGGINFKITRPQLERSLARMNARPGRATR
jgi:hypothetical protein